MTVMVPMLNPTIHYSAWKVIVVDGVITSTSRSEVPQGVPTASTSGLQSSGSSPKE